MPAAGWQREALKFLVSGGVNTAISWSAYLALNLVLPYKLAYSLAYLLGIGVSYVLQAKWVFRVPLSWRNFMAFPLVYVVQWLLGVALLTVMVERFGLPETWAPLAVIVATLPVTFVMSRFIIRKGRVAPTAGDAGPGCDTVKPS